MQASGRSTGASWRVGDVEQRVDLVLREQAGVGAGDVLGVEDHPQEAAGRVDAVGDPMAAAGGKEDRLPAVDHR